MTFIDTNIKGVTMNNDDTNNRALQPEQAKALEESLEKINEALAVEEKDREPGKPYIKHTHRRCV